MAGDELRGWITLAITLFSMIFGAGISFAVWAFRASMKPIKLLIEQNNAALATNSSAIHSLSETLVDHEVRLSDVETTHHILGCDQPHVHKG